MNTNATKPEFEPNIDTANEEIERQDNRIRELEAKLAAKPIAPAPNAEPMPTEPSGNAQGLRGVARTAAAS